MILDVTKKKRVVFNSDNQNEIKLVLNFEFHCCTKHVDLEYHMTLQLSWSI
jgi:hypothetical protein